MDTERLIQTLAVDNGTHARPVGQTLAMALLVALPVAAAMLLVTVGIRPDFMSAMHNPFFDLKFVVTLTLALPAILISLHLARPEASLRGWFWMLLLSPLVLVLAIAGEMMVPQRLPMMTRLVGRSAMFCVTAVPVLSMPILAATLLALRQGAPSRPALAGALAGLLSAGLAATIYAMHCIDDSPLFVATWYTLAAGVVAAIGALVGSKVLKY